MSEAINNGALQNLEYLDISYCISVSESSAVTLFTNCRRWKQLFFEGCPLLSNVIFTLACFPGSQLIEIGFDDGDIDLEAMTSLVRNCSQLQYINGTSPLYYCMLKLSRFGRNEVCEICKELMIMGWQLDAWAGPNAEHHSCLDFLEENNHRDLLSCLSNQSSSSSSSGGAGI